MITSIPIKIGAPANSVSRLEKQTLLDGTEGFAHKDIVLAETICMSTKARAVARSVVMRELERIT